LRLGRPGVKQILVVDEDRDLVKLLAFGLRLHRYFVEVAENGKDALSVLERRSFDAIVLDWNMTVMSGAEFVEQRRRRTAFRLTRPSSPVPRGPTPGRRRTTFGGASRGGAEHNALSHSVWCATVSRNRPGGRQANATGDDLGSVRYRVLTGVPEG
jgi:hypothetical protein